MQLELGLIWQLGLMLELEVVLLELRLVLRWERSHLKI
jgi:hypothetical protein